MNTTEKIVESYFRICRRCFTCPDVKIVGGNNRQIDLLAYDIIKGIPYHVETAVTHCQNWCPKTDELEERFTYKFFGEAKKKTGEKTDYKKGKNYYKQIVKTYASYGVDPKLLRRVFCCWVVADECNLKPFLAEYQKTWDLQNPIEVLSFRDEVIPELQKAVSTSNYEDEVLRTFSLLREFEKQTEK